MSEQNPHGSVYRVNFINLNGKLLGTTEFTGDKDAVIYLVDTVNQECGRKLRAVPETKGSGGVTLSEPRVING